MSENKKPASKAGKKQDVDMKELREQLDAAQKLAEDYLRLQVELEEANKKGDEYLLMAQRVQAEFENFRKRNATLRTTSLEDGRAEVLEALLPVMDNFDRALDAIEGDDSSREGVELIYKQLVGALKGFGCEAVQPVGEAFDPNLHNAVMQSPAEEGEEPGSIVEVMQKGYSMGEKILRYPMVRVASE